MSIINQMLKDLERRQKRETSTLTYATRSDWRQHLNGRFNWQAAKWLVLILSSTASVALLASVLAPKADYFYKPEFIKSVQTPVLSKTELLPANEVHITPNIALNIVWMNTEQGLRLTLESEKVIAADKFSMLQNDNMLIIKVQQAEFNAAAAAAASAALIKNPLLAVQLEQNADEVIIKIQHRAAIQTQKLLLPASDVYGFRWILDVQTLNDAQVVQSAGKTIAISESQKLARTEGVKRNFNKPSYKELNEQGLNALVSRDGFSAIDLYQQSLSLQADQTDIRIQLAALYLDYGKANEAFTVVEQGLALAPSHTRLNHLYARLLIDRNEIARAVDVLEAAKPYVKNDPEFFALLGAAYQRLQRPTESVAYYQQALSDAPAQAAWWLGLAIGLEQIADPKNAKQAYEKAQQYGGLNIAAQHYVVERLAALSQ
ncbi:MAG: tetratricopeptide repeat protein [Gammaproteobacteria bacterium]|nr:tetratricopeptide repeat protein [Gammaproteobacteria bacterium]